MTDTLIQTIARTLGPYVGDEEPDEAHLWAAHNIVTVLGKLGYAIVPREPTVEQSSAMFDAMDQHASCTCSPHKIYVAAITTGERNG